MSTGNHTLYRRYVRTACAMAEGYGLTEQALVDAVGLCVPGGRADLQTVREAVEWNVSKDFIRRRLNGDTDEHEWVITAKGLAKEEVR